MYTKNTMLQKLIKKEKNSKKREKKIIVKSRSNFESRKEVKTGGYRKRKQD